MPINVNKDHFDQRGLYDHKNLIGLNATNGWEQKSEGSRIFKIHSQLGTFRYVNRYTRYEKTMHHKEVRWRLVNGLKALAVTVFSLGLAALGSKEVQRLWKKAITGNEVKKINVLQETRTTYPLPKRFLITSETSWQKSSARQDAAPTPSPPTQKVEKQVDNRTTLSEVEQPLANIPALNPKELILKDFYLGEGKDAEGRTLQEVQNLPLDKKESVHHYIQWLFPLKVPSRFNSNAPLLTDSLLPALKQDPLMKAHVLASLNQMLTFYGLEWKETAIHPNSSFGTGSSEDRSKVWLTPGNHNHMRLSRILESLNLLGMKEESNSLFACLQEIYAKFPSKITLSTWNNWNEKKEQKAE
jgi:hypothetical protein